MFALDGGKVDKRREKIGTSRESLIIPTEADLASGMYQELHRLAVAKMRLERPNHTLQPTALVHEAYIRLAGSPDSLWHDRPRFLAMAARVMRNILVDHARMRIARKRGAGAIQVSLDDQLRAQERSLIDVLFVDEALGRLATFDPRQAQILELRFFSGMEFDEIASHIGVSTRTVRRDWTMARAWLHQELLSSTPSS